VRFISPSDQPTANGCCIGRVGTAAKAIASGATLLIIGQVLVGVSCPPVFLAAAVLIGKSYPVEQRDVRRRRRGAMAEQLFG